MIEDGEFIAFPCGCEATRESETIVIDPCDDECFTVKVSMAVAILHGMNFEIRKELFESSITGEGEGGSE